LTSFYAINRPEVKSGDSTFLCNMVNYGLTYSSIDIEVIFLKVTVAFLKIFV